jgi:outer membrane protein TolC
MINQAVFKFLSHELSPRPGRLDYSIRVTILVILAIIISEMFQLPETAYAAYIVLFISREEKSSTVMMAVIAFIAITVSVLVSIAAYTVCAGEAGIRIPLMAVLIFAGMYVSRISPLGIAGFVVGFLGTMMLTLVDIAPNLPLERLIELILWLWVAAVLALGLVIVGNILTGRTPKELLDAGITQRLELAGRILVRQKMNNQQQELWKSFIEGGSADLFKYLKPAKSHITSRYLVELECLTTLADEWCRLSVSQGPLTATAATYGNELICMSEAFKKQETVKQNLQLEIPQTQEKAGMLLVRIRETVSVLQEEYKASFNAPPSKAKEPMHLLADDAFSNPDYFRYALKATIAIMTCYILYNLHNWPGIRTCVITCFFVSLGTFGETAHKMTLRLIGASIGCGLGLAAIIFIMPQMSNIGDLILLMLPVVFISAWIVAGSEWFSYVGLQMSMAFFLCVLVGFGPSIDMTVARDRVIGVLLGNLVVSIVFSFLWPVHAAAQAQKALAGAIDKLNQLIFSPKPAGSSFIQYRNELIKARRFASFDIFEFMNFNAGKKSAIDHQVMEAAQSLGAAALIVGGNEGRLEGASGDSKSQSLSSSLSTLTSHLGTSKPVVQYAGWWEELNARTANLTGMVKKIGTIFVIMFIFSTGWVRADDEASSIIDPRHVYVLPELIDLAENNDPDTRIAWEESKQAALAIGLAKAAYLPQISAEVLGGHERLPSPAPKPFSDKGYFIINAEEVMPSVAIQWLLFDFGKTKSKVQEARQISLASKSALTGVHQKLIFDVSRAYFSFDAERTQLQVAKDTLKSAQRLEDAAEARGKNGLETSTAIAMARYTRAKAQFDLQEIKAACNDSYHQLLVVMGLIPTIKMEIADTSGRSLPPSLVGDVDVYIKRALADRPDLEAQLAKLRASEDEINASKASYYPSLGLLGLVSQNVGEININGGPEYRVHDPASAILLQLKLPLFDGGIRASDLGIARSKNEEAKQELKKAKDDAIRQVAIAYDTVVSTLAEYNSTLELVSAADMSFSASLDAYNNGVGTFTDVVTAQAEKTQAQSAKASAYASVLTSAAALAFSTGDLTTIDTLAQGDGL